MFAMEPVVAPDRKRSRPDAANGYHTPGAAASGQSVSKPCLKFFSTCGCPYGEGCHFSHYVPGGVSSFTTGIALKTTVKAPSIIAQPSLVAPHVASTTHSANGGGGANLGGFKSRLCKQFGTSEGCRFGDKCHFAHGERELKVTSNAHVEAPKGMASNAFVASVMFGEPPKGMVPNGIVSTVMVSEPPKGMVPNGYGAAMMVSEPPKSIIQNGYVAPMMVGEPPKGIIANGSFSIPLTSNHPPAVIPFPREPPPPGIVSSSSSIDKITIDAAMAGIIIGKGGMHAKEISRITGAKLAIRDHESDPNLRHVELEGTFDQIKCANQMVRDLLINKDPLPPKNAGSNPHNFKTKLCQNHAQGTCTFGERCHFAHGDAELRKPSLPA